MMLFPRWRSRAAARTVCAADLQRRYLTTVFHYVVVRIGSGAEAEDVTADVFAAAFERIHHCPTPAETDSVVDDPARAWLLGIARRKLADVYRRRSRRPQAVLEQEMPAPTEDGPAERALAAEAKRVLQTLLAELPEVQRDALQMKYVEERSLSEMAAILGKSPNAVGQLLHRARRAVQARGIAYFGTETKSEKDTEAGK